MEIQSLVSLAYKAHSLWAFTGVTTTTNTGGMNMETTKLSLVEQLKAELMERYGLRADQVWCEVTISTPDLDLGQQILKDFDRNEGIHHLDESQSCDQVYGTKIDSIWVHRKDGRFGQYVTEGGNDE